MYYLGLLYTVIFGGSGRLDIDEENEAARQLFQHILSMATEGTGSITIH